jgi:hypothetical protein
VKHKEHSQDEGMWCSPWGMRGCEDDNHTDTVIVLGAQAKHKRGEGKQGSAYINCS